MLAAGMRLGPYQILAPLGQGGMGEVYRARDLRLDREVAVKIVPEHLVNDSDRLARFQREAKAVAALAHPNILTLYDIGQEQGIPFAVTELLEGATLRSRLANAVVPWREALEIGASVADGLATAHAKGIVHRDIKPENLFLTTESRVKILDFGLARVALPAASELETSPYIPCNTDPGAVVGTVGYVSPEQLRGLPADARSDLFALGCVLYELISGKRPFLGRTAAETAVAILHDEPPPLASLGTDVPPEVEHVIRHCLAKEPEQRSTSARDLAFALRALLSGSAVLAPLPPTTLHQPKSRRRRREAIPSIAVLPLVNASADSEMEYLSDGITETIINLLSQLPRLRVMARSTVFRCKGRQEDAQAVGRELKVRAVLTGRVLRRDNHLVIKAELVDVADGSQLWGEHFKRDLADIFAVEETIAREIAAKLQFRLTGKEQANLARRPTASVAAYQLYLKGRYQWNKRTEEGLRKSIEHFRQAVEQDPTYALAWAGLADAYHQLGLWGIIPPRESFPQAKAAATKALEIDDSLAEAHASLAVIKKDYEYDFAGAERAFQRAIELNPNYATAHHWYGECLACMGRSVEAIAQLQRAQELDPLSLIINAVLGRHGYFFARQYERAIVQCQKTLEMDPSFWVGRMFLGLAYAATGQLREAVAEFQLARQYENNSETLAGLGYAYAISEQRAEAHQFLAELKELAQQQYVMPMNLAVIYVGLGDREQALAWLEKAYQDHNEWLSEIGVDPTFDSLRSDPRFTALLRRMDIPRSQTGTAEDRPIDSLAILPLANAAADPDMEFLSDGLAESIINQLARLPGLRVMSWNSVSRYTGQDVDALEVGRTLGVQAVLTGRVLARGDMLAIGVELVSVRDNTHVWGERYHRKPADVLALQEEIARDIVEKLRLRLSGEDQRRLSQRPTDNVEAYKLYLKGRYHWNKRSAEGLKKSIKLFEQAIDIDPTYALAYTGVADAYLNLGGWGHLAFREAYPRAKAAATRALAIDEQLSEAHVSLAMAHKEYDWDWSAAEREYRRALALNAKYAIGWQWYAEYLACVGRHDEASAMFQRAIELDPLSLIIHATMGRHGYYFARRYDEAVSHLKQTLDMDDKFWTAHLWLGWTYASIGRLDDALEELQTARALDDNLEIVAGLGYTHGRAGRHREAEHLLDELQQLSTHRYVSPILSALITIGMGEYEQALNWLERSYTDRVQMMSELKVESAFDPLRSDPRFGDLLRRVGLSA